MAINPCNRKRGSCATAAATAGSSSGVRPLIGLGTDIDLQTKYSAAVVQQVADRSGDAILSLSTLYYPIEEFGYAMGFIGLDRADKMPFQTGCAERLNFVLCFLQIVFTETGLTCSGGGGNHFTGCILLTASKWTAFGVGRSIVQAVRIPLLNAGEILN